MLTELNNAIWLPLDYAGSNLVDLFIAENKNKWAIMCYI